MPANVEIKLHDSKPTAAGTVKVRRVDAPDVELKPAERKQRGRKPNAKIVAPMLSMREAVFRRLGESAEVNAPEKKAIVSLPSVLAERTELITTAFNSARTGGQVSLAFEGVMIRALNSKDKARIPCPPTPMWVLYSGTGESAQEYPAPFDFPTKTHIAGVSAERVQAAYVSKMIREGLIDSAIYAVPRKEDEEYSRQWKHAAKIGVLAHCNATGRMVPTREVYGHQHKESKEDQPNYRVSYIILASTGERFTPELFVNSEAQAYAAAMDLMGNGAVRVTVESKRADKDGQIKPLDSQRYPLEAGKDRTKAWDFQGTAATLTRGGFAALQPDAVGEEYVASRNRDKWINRTFKHDRIWMKAQSDTAKFSHG